MMQRFIIALIRGYQVAISPFFPQSCRFFPSCSEYAVEAIRTFGVFKGTLKACVRVMKCHPLHPGGYDPI